MSGTATMLEAALDHARRGWPVFPCHTPIRGGCSCKDGERCKDIGKHPRIVDWPNQATTDPATIRQWWARWTGANIGIPTGAASGFFVLDVDPRHGGDDTLRDLEAQHGPLPATVESLTGGGGRHILFRYPGFPIKSGAGILGPGLDIRGDGGLIVAPPSLHASGRRYCWEASSDPDDVAIAEAPGWLLTMLKSGATTGNGHHDRRQERDWLALLQGASDGTRHTVATQIAGHFLGFGRPVEEVETLILGYLSQCRPPGDAEEQTKCRRMVRDFAAKDATSNGHSPSAAPPAERSWPVLAEEALHGLAGEIVRAIDPHTEADPVAVLAQFLAIFGCVLGRDPHFRVEWTRHPSKLFLVLVGETSKARKGTSLSSLLRIVDAADPSVRRLSGLSSGEGLIWQVRDPIYELKQDRKTKAVEQVLVDGGEDDKRLLIQEPEFAQALKLMTREGNILSPVIRQAFDDETLSPLTKHNRITATGSHIAIVGHITKAELLRHISETEMANGFCNRFIFLAVRRSKYLSNPKGVSLEQVNTLAVRLRKWIEQAHETASRGPLTRDDDAEALWAEVYPSLSDGKPGLTGAILGRGECHVMRLALTYALLDGETQIKTPHLKAALALWEYAEQSARYIFCDATGDAVADRILSALRTQGAMSETDIYADVFRCHVKSNRIQRALEMLLHLKLVTSTVEETNGRSRTLWRVA